MIPLPTGRGVLLVFLGLLIVLSVSAGSDAAAGLGALDLSKETSVLRVGVLNGLCSFADFRPEREAPLEGVVVSGKGASWGDVSGDLPSQPPSSSSEGLGDRLAELGSVLGFPFARLILGGRKGFLRTRSADSEMLFTSRQHLLDIPRSGAKPSQQGK